MVCPFDHLNRETFLYGFLAPILDYMLRIRLHVEPSRTQDVISKVLALHGALAAICSPIIGYFAECTSDRKTPLLLSLAFCIIGTYMIAAATSTPILYLGRAMQGIAGSTVWIIGFATVTETVSSDNIGTAIGFTFSLASAGTICGPALSGLLFETVGYWKTWSVPLSILIIDLAARVVMIDNRSETSVPSRSEDIANSATPLCARKHEESSSGDSFWRDIVCNHRVLINLFLMVTGTTILNSFHSTLPQHVQQTFGWGPSTAGFLFAGLVAPGVIVGPIAGWARDKYGGQPVLTIASILQAMSFFSLGIAGSDFSPYVSAQIGGKTIYVSSILATGLLRPFAVNIAAAELAAAGRATQERAQSNAGSKGSLLRVFAMMDTAASVGMAIGPMLGGLLTKSLGYKYMSWTCSKSSKIAGIPLLMLLGLLYCSIAVVSKLFL
ncbi:hypothetical protein PENARI_c039G10264 [Penicillium arizonense]|uniref:Major facilitator superfamily (MFS) profile domain-containing protein n=1 Tax=Penicillium arizonense TaxID=1835702 RepID=A0A1F5L359_PENAI|nr:hypothetical protein PENARI_c039G10264 [Penicillium arizonense]OGE47658.1 hypothetical protein PENARI_c039G10264 [Penicillium arizonense]